MYKIVKVHQVRVVGTLPHATVLDWRVLVLMLLAQGVHAVCVLECQLPVLVASIKQVRG